MHKRAQVSVEYMAMVGLSLAAFFVIWLYVNSSNASIQQDLKVGFGKQVVTRLADAVNLVSVQGSPAKIFVEVNNPEGVVAASPSSNSSCSNVEIMLVMTAPDGKTTEVFSPVAANVSGDLSFLVGNPGLRRIQVEAVDFFGSPCVMLSG
ncbi:hypothetical protein A3A40_00800 [Candidatus Kaiserbacteria bacterium RIFCSPLOWO2_01_FULL_54_20]|uniref:Uncharacterized protein n=1 Tax=Candidatus Kaiserbacteria bacterium RIFCSPLOWO2_01_FULL_54_20 TaxID=1798513 RepID=A0A1F6EJJ6_9BACT|nr:MAG: hypothetical protein A3A40_00800 [Candidatus Kaiserbacteria bacterium RIFCSPLOWO2_01_FULL_54_20]HLD62960.1 hypothetical protein [Candidatus Norongarragalinales archaeon]